MSADEIIADTELPSFEEWPPVLAEAPPPPRFVLWPRLWTVFVAYGAAFVAMIILPALFAIIALIWMAGTGSDPRHLKNDFASIISTPGGFLTLAGLGQLGIGLTPIAAAWFSPEPMTQRLGIGRPSLPLWAYPVVTVGSLFPFAIGAMLATALMNLLAPNAENHFDGLLNQMHGGWTVAFILFISLSPGLTEELLFRGYIQRRLLERFSPGAGIWLSTILFAVIHVIPLQVVLTLVIGPWLGVIAWRTGSIWPSAICHAFCNAASMIYQFGIRGEMIPREIPTPVLAWTGGIVVGCFLLSVWILARVKPLNPYSSSSRSLASTV
ncbi:MAG: CPBP family intramembrane glutamic endopeptidase [Gemmataceae bacterium]